MRTVGRFLDQTFSGLLEEEYQKAYPETLLCIKGRTATDDLNSIAEMKARFRGSIKGRHFDSIKVDDPYPVGKVDPRSPWFVAPLTQFNQPSQETRAMITQDQRNAVAMKALGSVYTHKTKWTDDDLEAPILNNLFHIGYSEATISFTEFANIRTVLRRLLNALGK